MVFPDSQQREETRWEEISLSKSKERGNVGKISLRFACMKPYAQKLPFPQLGKLAPWLNLRLRKEELKLKRSQLKKRISTCLPAIADPKLFSERAIVARSFFLLFFIVNCWSTVFVLKTALSSKG